MSYEIAAIIILLSSLTGMLVILFRKIPVLAELPEIPAKKINWRDTLLKLKEKIKILNPFKSFSYEIFLQKLLSKIRILSLKSENKTSSWLQKLRARSLKNKLKKNDNYWQKIKKLTKNK